MQPPSTVVTPDGTLRGPDLPDDRDWPDQTCRWWLTWRISPQSQTFTDSDWDFLLDTALLHAAFWSGNNTVAAELRLRVAKFGATPEDRLRLRMQVEDPEPGKPAEASEPEQGGRYGHLRSVKPA
jgi:hypothetical protein